MCLWVVLIIVIDHCDWLWLVRKDVRMKFSVLTVAFHLMSCCIAWRPWLLPVSIILLGRVLKWLSVSGLGPSAKLCAGLMHGAPSAKLANSCVCRTGTESFQDSSKQNYTGAAVNHPGQSLCGEAPWRASATAPGGSVRSVAVCMPPKFHIMTVYHKLTQFSELLVKCLLHLVKLKDILYKSTPFHHVFTPLTMVPCRSTTSPYFCSVPYLKSVLHLCASHFWKQMQYDVLFSRGKMPDNVPDNACDQGLWCHSTMSVQITHWITFFRKTIQ